MERELAYIAKIQKVAEIPKYDKVELATVENWDVIVGKGDYIEGDLVCYIEYDSILPVREEFDFLRARCWSNLYQGYRIRNMKMCGVFSSGIIFPLSILPENIKVFEGANIAKLLGVIKYDPEEMKERKTISVNPKYSPLVKWLLQFKLMRKILLGKRQHKRQYPETVHKSGETNIQKNFDTMKGRGGSYYLTEKLEGQSFTCLLLGHGRRRQYMVFSHNAFRSSTQPSNWQEISDKYKFEELLRSLKQNLAIQGEIVGKSASGGSIQGNIYGLTELKLYIYKITDTDTGVPFEFKELKAFCVYHNLHMVPVLAENVALLGSVEEMLVHADGESVLKKNVKREGIIWRSQRDQSSGCKAKSRKYMVEWAKKDITL